ncbi:MAG: substrate-binding domain-containing protein [Pseudomonadota bacterium]
MPKQFTRGIALILAGALACSVNAQTIDLATDEAAGLAFVNSLAALYESETGSTLAQETVATGLALRKAATGEVDVAASTRATDDERRQERQLTLFPVVWDALVVVVHLDNPITNIRLDQLAGLYEAEITRWSDLGGETVPIDLITHETSSEGIDYNIGELILRDAGAELRAARRLQSTDDILGAVESSPTALAMVTYSAARKRRLKLLTVEGTAPGPSTIGSGDYLLYLPLYLAVRADAANRRDVRQLIRLASRADARRVLRRNGVLPYADGLSLASAQLERDRMLDGLRTSR